MQTVDLLITRRKLTVSSGVFRRDALHGTCLGCSCFSYVLVSSLHEWLHAARVHRHRGQRDPCIATLLPYAGPVPGSHSCSGRVACPRSSRALLRSDRADADLRIGAPRWTLGPIA
jgi:hypothetical protein